MPTNYYVTCIGWRLCAAFIFRNGKIPFVIASRLHNIYSYGCSRIFSVNFNSKMCRRMNIERIAKWRIQIFEGIYGIPNFSLLICPLARWPSRKIVHRKMRIMTIILVPHSSEYLPSHILGHSFE